MKIILCKCVNCGISFNKPQNEYNRKIKLNTPLYCSRRCVGLANPYKFGNRRVSHPSYNKGLADPFKYYITIAKRRKKDFNLDIEYLKELWNTQNGICPYTGLQMILTKHISKYNPPVKDRLHKASLDRIDSSKGYIKGNVQFVCLPINYMKNDLSDIEIKGFINEIKTGILDSNQS